MCVEVCLCGGGGCAGSSEIGCVYLKRIHLNAQACNDLQFDSHLLDRSFSNECFHFRHSSVVGLMRENHKLLLCVKGHCQLKDMIHSNNHPSTSSYRGLPVLPYFAACQFPVGFLQNVPQPCFQSLCPGEEHKKKKHVSEMFEYMHALQVYLSTYDLRVLCSTS